MKNRILLLSFLMVTNFAHASEEPSNNGSYYSWRYNETNLKCFTPVMGSTTKALPEEKCPPPKLEYKWGVDKRNGNKKCYAFLANTSHLVETIYSKPINSAKKCDGYQLPLPEIAGDGFAWKVQTDKKNLICYNTFSGKLKGVYKPDHPNCPPPKLVYKWGIDKKSNAVKCQAFLSSSNLEVVTIYDAPIDTAKKCDRSLLPKDEVNFHMNKKEDDTVNSSRSPKVVPEEVENKTNPAKKDTLTK